VPSPSLRSPLHSYFFFGRYGLSLKLIAVLDPTWGGCFEIWFGSFPSKTISAVVSTSWSGQSGPYVVCQYKFFSASYLICLVLPQVGTPRTGLTGFRVDFFCFPAVWLHLTTQGELFDLYCFIKYIHLNYINIFYQFLCYCFSLSPPPRFFVFTPPKNTTRTPGKKKRIGRGGGEVHTDRNNWFWCGYKTTHLATRVEDIRTTIHITRPVSALIHERNESVIWGRKLWKFQNTNKPLRPEIHGSQWRPVANIAAVAMLKKARGKR
jgi:hypothetical protein